MAIAAAWIGQTVFFAWRRHAPFPNWELLLILDTLRTSGLGPALWFPLEGHRMIFPRLLLLADHYLVRGSSVLVFTVVLAAHAIMVLAVARIVWRVLPSRLMAAAAAWIAVLAFGPYYGLFSDTANTWPTIAHFFSFAALFSTWRGLKGERTDWRWLAGSGLFSLGGAFSGLAGILAWPVMLWFAVARRQWPAIIVPLTAMAVFGVTGMTWVHGAGDVVNLLVHPIHSMTAFALHVGAVIENALFVRPFSDSARIVALGGGLAGVLGASVFLLQLTRRPERAAGAEGLIGGLMAFSLLWLAAATGKHVQPGEPLAVQGRFFLQSGWFWALFGLMIMMRLAAWPRSKWILPAAVLAIIAFLAPSAILSGLRADARGSVNQAAHAGVLAGIDDPELWGTLSLTSAEDSLWRPLRTDRAGPFARWPTLVPTDGSPRECPSTLLLGNAPVPHGVRLWGELPKGGTGVMITDPRKGKIGAGLSWRPPLVPRLAPEPLRRAGNAGWWGYAEAPDGSATLVVFDRGGREICRGRWPEAGTRDEGKRD